MTGHCKHCEKRGCGSYHDQCEKYQAFRKTMKEIESKRAQNRSQQDCVYSCVTRMKNSPNTSDVWRSRKSR